MTEQHDVIDIDALDEDEDRDRDEQLDRSSPRLSPANVGPPDMRSMPQSLFSSSSSSSAGTAAPVDPSRFPFCDEDGNDPNSSREIDLFESVKAVPAAAVAPSVSSSPQTGFVSASSTFLFAASSSSSVTDGAAPGGFVANQANIGNNQDTGTPAQHLRGLHAFADLFTCLDTAFGHSEELIELGSALRAQIQTRFTNIEESTLAVEASLEWKRLRWKKQEKPQQEDALQPSAPNSSQAVEVTGKKGRAKGRVRAKVAPQIVSEMDDIDCVLVVLSAMSALTLVKAGEVHSYLEHLSMVIHPDRCVIVVVQGLIEGVVKRQKQMASVTKQQVLEAFAAVQVCPKCAKVVGIHHSKTVAETAQFVFDLMTFLAEQPYIRKPTQLDSETMAGLSASLLGNTGAKARTPVEGWRALLQHIPRVSEGISHVILNHYPTLGSLYEIYEDPQKSEEEKRNLLSALRVYGPSSGSAGRAIGPALSAKVYEALMSTDPTTPL